MEAWPGQTQVKGNAGHPSLVLILMAVGRDCYLFFVSGIPEDPRTAEEYYADAFDSCTEESEEEEEETVFLGLEDEAKNAGLQPDDRTNQQVQAAPHQREWDCRRGWTDGAVTSGEPRKH